MSAIETYLAEHTIQCERMHARISRSDCEINLQRGCPSCVGCPVPALMLPTVPRHRRVIDGDTGREMIAVPASAPPLSAYPLEALLGELTRRLPRAEIVLR